MVAGLSFGLENLSVIRRSAAMYVKHDSIDAIPDTSAPWSQLMGLRGMIVPSLAGKEREGAPLLPMGNNR